MKTYKARLTGVSPLLMHSCVGLNVLDPMVKEIKKLTGKKKKTDDDLLEIKRLEWRMGLYLDDEGRVTMPADNILATVIAGARKSKMGKQAEAAVFEAQPFFTVNYDGPKDIDALYKDGRFCDYRPVRNQQNRVMRSRPIFRQWSIDINLQFDESILDPDALKEAVRVAGEQIGLGDYRPRYGRFTVEAIK